MNIFLIYRFCKNLETGQMTKITPIEYNTSETEASKYARLFDLQVPADLKSKIGHTYTSSHIE